MQQLQLHASPTQFMVVEVEGGSGASPGPAAGGTGGGGAGGTGILEVLVQM